MVHALFSRHTLLNYADQFNALDTREENLMKIKFTLLLIHLPLGETICYLSPFITYDTSS